MGHVHEPGGQRPHQAIDHGSAGVGTAGLERQQVHFQDLVCHACNLPRTTPGPRVGNRWRSGYGRRPMAIVLGLIVALTYGTGDFFGGLAAKRTPAFTVVIGSFGLAAACSRWSRGGWLLVGTPPTPEPSDLWLGVAVGADRAGRRRPPVPGTGHGSHERGGAHHRGDRRHRPARLGARRWRAALRPRPRWRRHRPGFGGPGRGGTRARRPSRRCRHRAAGQGGPHGGRVGPGLRHHLRAPRIHQFRCRALAPARVPTAVGHGHRLGGHVARAPGGQPRASGRHPGSRRLAVRGRSRPPRHHAPTASTWQPPTPGCCRSWP